jgi:hypothetical protein
MKLSALLIMIGVLLAGTGCGEAPAQPAEVRMDITVRNASSENIYVVVNSGARHEDFGVVGAGFGKTIGFGITPVGQTVTMDWSVGNPDAAKYQIKDTRLLPKGIDKGHPLIVDR